MKAFNYLFTVIIGFNVLIGKWDDHFLTFCVILNIIFFTAYFIFGIIKKKIKTVPLTNLGKMFILFLSIENSYRHFFSLLSLLFIVENIFIIIWIFFEIKNRHGSVSD